MQILPTELTLTQAVDWQGDRRATIWFEYGSTDERLSTDQTVISALGSSAVLNIYTNDAHAGLPAQLTTSPLLLDGVFDKYISRGLRRKIQRADKLLRHEHQHGLTTEDAAFVHHHVLRPATLATMYERYCNRTFSRFP